MPGVDVHCIICKQIKEKDMGKFVKLFKKMAEEATATELFEKAEKEALKELEKKYILSKVVPVAINADEDCEKAITIEEPNLLGIKFAFALVKESDDGRNIQVSILAKTINELGIEHAELIRHSEQNINPTIKIEKFQDTPELAFFILLLKKTEGNGQDPG